MKRYLLLTAICALVVASCAVAVKNPTAADLEAADYGLEPADSETQAMAYLKDNLFDPMSAVVEWQGDCVKGWWRVYDIPGNIFSSSKLYYGWKREAKINAKNKMGGYIGFKLYTFCYRDGKLLHVFSET